MVELPSDAAYARDTFENPENKSLLLKLLAELHGAPLTLSFTLGTAPNPQAAPPGSAATTAAATAATTAADAASTSTSATAVLSGQGVAPDDPSFSTSPSASGADALSEQDSILFETFGITFEEA
jgi:hypothetical protein